jgi:hypothetical protein
MHVRGSTFTAAIIEQCLKACSMSAGIELEVSPAWLEESRERCVACVLECESFLGQGPI